MTSISKSLRLLALTAASAALLAACGGGSDDDSLDDRADLADPKIRFVHAVPGGPNVTLQRNGSNESGVTNVAYKFASQYYDVGTENYSFTLRTAAGGVQVAAATVDARRGNKYTLLALPTTSGVELQEVRDPYNKSLTNKDARVRVVNAAVNAQVFDVYLTPVGVDFAGTAPLLPSIGYKQVKPATGNDSVNVTPGAYKLRLTPAGSKTPFFTATVSAPENGDWLLVALPEDGAAANAVRLLLVRADDTADATDEIVGE